MNNSDLPCRSAGVCFDSEGRAEISLWAPHASQAELYLVSQNAYLSLQSHSRGFWHLTTKELKPGGEYFFRLNGGKHLPDPASLSQPEGIYGPSQAIDLRGFQWQDQDWKNPNLQDYIIYELHTGTFTSQGTFAGIEQKLDYLVELGITAIEIMPVSQFAGERNWGYDGVFPFCVQNSYGSATGLQQLVDACHKKGLAVILDVVYNHVGPEGNILAEFGPYFTEKYSTPWGNAINFDDAWCDAVRQYFIQNALMWFRDFHIDALRLDAVHAIKDFSPVHILKEIRQQADELEKQSGRRHYMIVELDLNDDLYITPTAQGGYGMEGQWIDEFHHALRVTSGQEKIGYYSDFDGITSLAKAYTDAYVYDGQYSEHRKKTFGARAKTRDGKQFVVFSQNHDQVGNRMLGERTSELVSFEMQKLLAGAVFVSPYLPMLFMGEEYAETNRFQYFISHTDAQLVQMVRQGRKKEFGDFHNDEQVPDPAGAETFENSKLQWKLPDQGDHKIMLDFYKRLIAIRKSYASLRNLNRDDVRVLQVNAEDGTLILFRSCLGEQVICLMNFSDQPKTISLDHNTNNWEKLLASSDREWAGKQELPSPVSTLSGLTLPAESISLYINKL
ncbi:malto-oligosyltrehalose trehalohydrolase [Dyadobacter luteus]|uniref:Malto-oligosyltrehalose trehalohydrolase n=1 Tax=Dyadobacter luteus TaxID=2259619 RepID=A0A3D8YES4_9BACT|nr:malto-oligosyltrehalose trehalohydrolase [Dyadobacter luteus]REA63064.1 malto-oligosyltrehalose trehalohydrolase [Dyadobacter luteus]